MPAMPFRPRLEPTLAVAGLLLVAILVGFAPVLAVDKKAGPDPADAPLGPSVDLPQPSTVDAQPPDEPADQSPVSSSGSAPTPDENGNSTQPGTATPSPDDGTPTDPEPEVMQPHESATLRVGFEAS